MKIRFLPDGGFNKGGAFVEYRGDAPEGDEPEYELDGFLRLEIQCDAMEVTTSAGIISEGDEPENPDRPMKSWIAGKGMIQPARYGSFSLSFLGKKKTHHEVSIVIRPQESKEEVWFQGAYREADFESPGEDKFFLQIEVHPSKFNMLLSELAEPESILSLYVVVEAFPNFFTTWSPIYDEGRVIKYLNDKRDVENTEEVPESFWQMEEERKGLSSNPVELLVSRPLKSIPGSAEDHNNPDVGDEQPDDFAEESPTDNLEQTLQIERNNKLNAQVGLAEAVIKQIRAIGRWILVCLIILIVAVIIK